MNLEALWEVRLVNLYARGLFIIVTSSARFLIQFSEHAFPHEDDTTPRSCPDYAWRLG